MGNIALATTDWGIISPPTVVAPGGYLISIDLDDLTLPNCTVLAYLGQNNSGNPLGIGYNPIAINGLRTRAYAWGNDGFTSFVMVIDIASLAMTRINLPWVGPRASALISQGFNDFMFWSDFYIFAPTDPPYTWGFFVDGITGVVTPVNQNVFGEGAPILAAESDIGVGHILLPELPHIEPMGLWELDTVGPEMTFVQATPLAGWDTFRIGAIPAIPGDEALYLAYGSGDWLKEDLITMTETDLFSASVGGQFSSWDVDPVDGTKVWQLIGDFGSVSSGSVATIQQMDMTTGTVLQSAELWGPEIPPSGGPNGWYTGVISYKPAGTPPLPQSPGYNACSLVTATR